MEEINLIKVIQRVEALYKHYKRVYRRVRFLCCSDQAYHAKEKRNHYKDLLEKKLEKRVFKSAYYIFFIFFFIYVDQWAGINDVII